MDLSINLSPYPAPKTYPRYGTDAYIDPFRQILVPATPESILLYKMELYVHKTMGVPKNRMSIQQSLRKFGINSTKIISIVIQDVIDGRLVPIAIVDCTAPGKNLSFVPLSHLEEFAKMRHINYIIVTNGTEVDSYISRADRLSFWKIDNVPDYPTLQAGHRQMLETALPYKEPEDLVRAKAKVKQGEKINRPHGEKAAPIKLQRVDKTGPTTPPKTRPLHPLMSQLETLLMVSKKRIPQTKHWGIELVLDCGKRKKGEKLSLSPVEASLQRTFLIEDYHKNHQLMSVDIEQGLHPSGNPAIAVTLDHFETRQTVFCFDFTTDIKVTEIANATSPQGPGYALHLDLNLAFEASGYDFSSGLIAKIKAHAEAAKLDPLTEFKFIGPNQLFLGEVYSADDQSQAKLIMGLMALALIVDEYRETLKRDRKRQK